MSQRERYLAIAVGVVVVLFVVQFGVQKVMTTLSDKQQLIDDAISENGQLTKLITNGSLADRKLKTLVTRSLPKDKEELKAEYTAWLAQLGNEVDMQGIRVDSPERPSKTTPAYTAYNFTLQGVIRKDQVLDLMAKFYDKNLLHNLIGLKVVKTRDDNIINVTLTSQALALSEADLKQEASSEPSGRLAMSLDEYKKAILNRNPFSPPNKPPSLKLERRYEIVRGEDWRLSLHDLKSDPENHAVHFDLLSEELPPGMEFDEGSFRWQPEENGEYEVAVSATDSGWPRASTEEKLVVSVVDPPPPEEKKPEPPKFDTATQTYLTGLTGGRTGKKVWIRSRTDGKSLELKEGSDFELGSVQAKVIEINLDEDFVELESEGRRWILDMDMSLAEAYRKSQVD